MDTSDKKICICVTNDLTSDQRVLRIANSLTSYGYDITLYGRIRSESPENIASKLSTERKSHLFNNGFLFYTEYQLRLFTYLLFSDFDVFYSVDLDTLPACRLAQLVRRKKIVFDSHEAFTEVPELEGRTVVKSIWKMVGRLFLSSSVPTLTVSQSVKEHLKKSYNVKAVVLRNMPTKKDTYQSAPIQKPIKLLYQGKLNKGRGIEDLIRAVVEFPEIELHIIGDGDLHFDSYPDNVFFYGFIPPDQLHPHTIQYDMGLNLLDGYSKNYKWSLANKYFDYIQAGLPVVTMDYPEYRRLNEEYQSSILLPNIEPSTLKEFLSGLLQNQYDLDAMKSNVMKARERFVWEEEHVILKGFIDGV